MQLARPLWRLEDLLTLCFQPEELHRCLVRKYPQLAPELPSHDEPPAQFVHKIVTLLERHGSIDAQLFVHLLASRPLRRAQIMSAACALEVDSAAIESFIAFDERTHVFRSPGVVEPKMVDALEDLVLEREHTSPDDPRRGALSEDIERLAAQIRARRPPKPGDRIAGTILEYLIGRGSFGTVWRARDIETGESRATKLFDLTRLTDGIMLWRFRRSIRALQVLHKHRGAPASIARVLSVADDQLAFSMEYLPRGSLEQIAQRSWTLDERLAVFHEICQAVIFAHKCGVIHRDIKPSNVIFDANSQPVLIDFDIAAVMFLTEQRLTTGGLGTPMFAAPEQIECAGEVDERADVYSLGRLLHYLLIERIPTCSEQDTLLENLSRYPPSLALSIKKATQRNPVDRFTSVNQLCRDVENYKTGWSAIRAHSRRILHSIRRNAVLLVLASSTITGLEIHAEQQKELAAAHLRHKLESDAQLAEKEELAAQLAGIQTELVEVRRQHESLERQLADAKAQLNKLQQHELALMEPNAAHKLLKQRIDLHTEISTLESSLKEKKHRLDVLNERMGATVERLAMTRIDDNYHEPSPAAPVAQIDAAAPAVTQPPPPSPTGARKIKVKVGVTASAPVDLITRERLIKATLRRLEPQVGRCRDQYTSLHTKAILSFMVDATGTKIHFRHLLGDLSEKTRDCLKRLLLRQKFPRMKANSAPSTHSHDYTFR